MSVRLVSAQQTTKEPDQLVVARPTAATTAVTMLPSPTNLAHYQTEVTAVTHLVPPETTSPSVTYRSINEVNLSQTTECSSTTVQPSQPL